MPPDLLKCGCGAYPYKLNLHVDLKTEPALTNRNSQHDLFWDVFKWKTCH